MISERFAVNDLPEGWFFLPLKAGGLGIRGPLPELFAVMDTLSQAKNGPDFESCLEEERLVYRNYQERWEGHVDSRYDLGDTEDFISYEEFTHGRETHLRNWADKYELMKTIPLPSPVQATPGVEALLARSSATWTSMSFFDKWVTTVYGEGVAAKFGSIDPVDSTLIPLGMVNMFTQARMKWDQ